MKLTSVLLHWCQEENSGHFWTHVRKSFLAYISQWNGVFSQAWIYIAYLFPLAQAKCLCVQLRVCVLFLLRAKYRLKAVTTDPHLRNTQNGYLAGVCNDLLVSFPVDCCHSLFSLEVRFFYPHTNTYKNVAVWILWRYGGKGGVMGEICCSLMLV